MKVVVVVDTEVEGETPREYPLPLETWEQMKHKVEKLTAAELEASNETQPPGQKSFIHPDNLLQDVVTP